MGHWRDPGGTPGGIGEFLGGIALCGLGVWMLASRVVVHGGAFLGGWLGAGMGSGGGGVLTMVVPLVAGVALLFRDAGSRWGWVLVAVALGLMTLDILTSLDFHFRATPLPMFLVMVGAVGAGLGLVLRSLRDHARGR